MKIIKFSDFSENGGNSPLFAPGAENAMNYQGFRSVICDYASVIAKSAKIAFSQKRKSRKCDILEIS